MRPCRSHINFVSTILKVTETSCKLDTFYEVKLIELGYCSTIYSTENVISDGDDASNLQTQNFYHSAGSRIKF